MRTLGHSGDAVAALNIASDVNCFGTVSGCPSSASAVIKVAPLEHDAVAGTAAASAEESATPLPLPALAIAIETRLPPRDPVGLGTTGTSSSSPDGPEFDSKDRIGGA